MVARVEPRVNGIAAAGAGWLDMGERPRLAGAGAVPGAPIPVDAGVVMVICYISLVSEQDKNCLGECVAVKTVGQHLDGAEKHHYFQPRNDQVDRVDSNGGQSVGGHDVMVNRDANKCKRFACWWLAGHPSGCMA